MIIDCKTYALEILDKVKNVDNKKGLAVITVGHDDASESYVRGKKKDCEYCGIPFKQYSFEATDSPYLVLECIHTLNNDKSVGGIILQLPTAYPHSVEKALIHTIQVTKDVDGFKRQSRFRPCTPEGIVYLMKQIYGDLTGKDVLIIGRGKLVGYPLIDMLLYQDCTVTVAHSKSDLDTIIAKHYDVAVVAANKANMVHCSKINADTIIDVGVFRIDGKFTGCVDGVTEFHEGKMITPVPGGVGLLTRAMLMAHIASVSNKHFEY